METELLYIIYTYNRKGILSKCWNTLFDKNVVRPNRVLICDDGSLSDVKAGLFHAHLSTDIPIDFLSIGKNIGYGALAEKAFALLETYNPSYVFFIESDYVFKEHGLDIVMDLFKNNEYGKECVAFSGYDNPDFGNKEKTDIIFPRIIKEDYGNDNLNRSIMYKPFKQNTNFGEIDLELVSNSCGTMYFNWNKIRELMDYDKESIEIWIDKVVTRSPGLLHDGCMSHGISYLWTEYIKDNYPEKYNKYAALLNIKPSVANHYNGMGINGKVINEGSSFVSSPTWVEN